MTQQHYAIQYIDCTMVCRTHVVCSASKQSGASRTEVAVMLRASCIAVLLVQKWQGFFVHHGASYRVMLRMEV
jgi:hypothetical protein